MTFEIDRERTENGGEMEEYGAICGGCASWMDGSPGGGGEGMDLISRQPQNGWMDVFVMGSLSQMERCELVGRGIGNCFCTI